MKSGLLFDPFVVVFDVVVVIFYKRVCLEEKSGENGFPSLVSSLLWSERRERTKTCRCCGYKEDEDEDERFFLVCSFALVLS